MPRNKEVMHPTLKGEDASDTSRSHLSITSKGTANCEEKDNPTICRMTVIVSHTVIFVVVGLVFAVVLSSAFLCSSKFEEPRAYLVGILFTIPLWLSELFTIRQTELQEIILENYKSPCLRNGKWCG